MTRLYTLLVCGTLTGFLTGFHTPAACASDGAIRIQQINQVVENWNPNQHLYVKGNFGVNDQRLAELERWLDANGKHWVVVLMETANGEVSVAPDGRVFQGMDAVEYALGQGLGNQTGFGRFEHPVTGERDGAVFVLFYRERKFSYYSSDAQDRHGLGQSNWPGKLDRPAFRAMRGGERIVDAAKDTVTSISSQLDKRVAAEQAELKREARARARAVAQMRLQIESLRQEIAQVAGARDQMLASYPKATGDLTNPPLSDWQERLASIDDKLTPESVRDVSSEFETLSFDVSAYLNAYAAGQSLDENMADISESISNKGAGPNDIAEPIYQEAREELDQARLARATGDRALTGHLEKARTLVASADSVIEQEEVRVKRVTARNRAIKLTALGTTTLSGLVLGGVLIFLNRRRAPAKSQALQTFAKRKETVTSEMDNVLGLFTRSNEVLGSKDKVEKRGYVGETDKLSDSTFESVDDLLIMSNEVERVMDEAEEMLEPKNPIDKVINTFSASNYEKAVNHISGEPLTFRRDQGLPAVIEKDLPATPGEEPPQAITMTFEKVFDAFRKRCNDANATLDQLENSLLTANDSLIELEKEIEDISSKDRVLHELADGDGFFITPNLFEVLLPSVQSDYDAADAIAATDPVLATRKHIPLARRKLADAKHVIESTELARRKIFPELDECRALLSERDYEIGWIETKVLELSATANELYALAAKTDASGQAMTFRASVEQLGVDARKCVTLAEEVSATLTPGLTTLSDRIAEGRDTIAGRLRIPASQCLTENNYNPDTRLAFAKEQIQACQAAIHRGNAAAAEDAAAAARESLAEGHSIVDDSIAALNDFEGLHRKRATRHATIAERIPKLAIRLKENHGRFADSALAFKAADSAFPDPHETIDDALQDAEEKSATSNRNLSESQSIYARGQVLEAVALLNDVETDCMHASTRFDDIEQHLTRVQQQRDTNDRQIKQSLNRAEALHRELKDPRITRPTIDRYEGIASEMHSIRQALAQGNTKRDPFAEAKPMKALSDRIDELQAQLDGDKNAHAEAFRAVRGAKTQLVTAQRLVDRAATDDIPDSPLTTQCVREVRELDGALTVTEKRLDIAHDQWQEVDADAARIHSSLGVTIGRLQGELEGAQRTVESFRLASRNVIQATRWSGPFGIRVHGSPGAQELERARAFLNSGDYGSVARMVRAASMAAQSAIQQAEREVARKRRDEARRAEAARRRRMRSAGAVGGLGGLGGGGRSSRPSRTFNRPSAPSRPSRPNNSGFSRSGW